MTIFSNRDIGEILQIVEEQAVRFYEFNRDSDSDIGSSDLAALYRDIILELSGLDIFNGDRDKVSDVEMQMIRNGVHNLSPI